MDGAADSKATKSSVSELVGVAASTPPVGTSKEPRSLVAEGSNFTRPLRLGLKWWGFVQADYQNNQISEDQLNPDGHPINQNQFGLRRGRLRIDHGWQNAFATLELDAGTLGDGPHVRVRRAEASLLYRGAVPDDITPLLVVTAGVTDVPFGAEIAESQRDRVFVERSVGSLALFRNEADLGVKAWGAYRFLNYAVALVNGEPLTREGFPTDPNADKDVVGHFGAQAEPLEHWGLTGGVSFYTGKGFSAGRAATKDSLSWVDVNNNGAVDVGEVYGATASAAVPSQNFDRWALGLDFGIVYQSALGVSRFNAEAFVASNMDRGLLPSDPVTSGADARQTGLTLSLLQQITNYGVIGFRGAFYDPNSDLFEARAGVFHLTNQTFWALSPVLGLTLDHGRLLAQYDFVFDNLGRDDRGVPTDASNNQLTVRLQVDL